MAFRAVVVATLVALASAGMDPSYMNMMGNMMGGNMMAGGMQQQQHHGGGCNPAMGGAGCQIPAGVDVGEYIEKQLEQQQYETKQMAERIKAQFQRVMRQVTMKKHRYAMSVMTEFTSMCACLRESINIYQAMFVENAKNLNLTDVVDFNTMNMRPYEAKSAKEARELIFAGLLQSMCTTLGEYMNFATQVENNLDIIRGTVTPNPTGEK